jgi:hypothetical protein
MVFNIVADFLMDSKVYEFQVANLLQSEKLRLIRKKVEILNNKHMKHEQKLFKTAEPRRLSACRLDRLISIMPLGQFQNF